MRDFSQIITSESHRGKNTDELVHFLRERGWPEPSAKQFIRNVLAKDRAHALAEQELADTDELSNQKNDLQSGSQPAAWALVVVIGLLLAMFLWMGAMHAL